ncbi:MAG: hypothetical protein MKZ68_00870 [Candidatus Thalassarchaeum sp.]|nr:hypothetical protein [Candidatus Thalassarchaeum sp.]|tara:strand:+ start:561 stop:1184 length:624 start_codon:yes stop_codon:yes gene_type:complete
MSRYISPSPFHTFEPLQHDPLDLIPPIQCSQGGDHSEIKSLEGVPSSIIELEEGENPPIDPAMMLFLCSVAWKEDGGIPEPLDRGVSRDRIGRFPIEGGNAIEYLLNHTIEKTDDGLHDLLAKLTLGLDEEFLGEGGFSSGKGGLELCGWLDKKDVINLRRAIQKGKWAVDPSEPIDGGVADAFRHLTIILRGAEKRRCGILMRKHN